MIKEEIETVCNKLSLPKFVVEDAVKIMESSFHLFKNNAYSHLSGVFVYASCRVNSVARTIADVSFASNIRRKDITRLYNRLVYEQIITVLPPCPKRYLSRIATILEINGTIERKALDMIDKIQQSKKITIGSPEVLAATCLWLVGKDKGMTQPKIAIAAGITPMTIKYRAWKIQEELET